MVEQNEAGSRLLIDVMMKHVLKDLNSKYATRHTIAVEHAMSATFHGGSVTVSGRMDYAVVKSVVGPKGSEIDNITFVLEAKSRFQFKAGFSQLLTQMAVIVKYKSFCVVFIVF